MTTTWDAIVVGAGGVGSAAAWQLARRGARTLVLDPFGRAHARGSSHGQTRIIRRAYFEHPDYVPLVERALTLWHELERESGQTLFERVGLVQVGPREGTVLAGVRASARQHGLEVAELSATETVARWPDLRVPEAWSAIFEPGAGLLWVERCVLAHLELAERAGARLALDEPLMSWRASGPGVEVETPRGRYAASRLVVAAGPWSSRVLGSLGVELRVLRKPQFWFRIGDGRYRATEGFPAWLYETDDGVFYGFPSLRRGELKAAEHSGGAVVPDPSLVDRELDPAGLGRLTEFLARHLPRVELSPVAHSVCLYTLSPDEHFVVDHLPEAPQVVLAAGLSGHGFKFTSVLGEVLAELALDGQSRQPVEFLRLSRPGLRSAPA